MTEILSHPMIIALLTAHTIHVLMKGYVHIDNHFRTWGHY
jgi:hypothetical protein